MNRTTSFEAVDQQHASARIGQEQMRGRPSLAIDIGGSFTDVVLMAGDALFTLKVLTTPHAPEEGVMQGITEILERAGMRASDVALFILGTTLATNALIERKGARTALVMTDGFRDVVEIGQENRFDQYDVFIEKPAPLVPRHLRFGIPERVDVHGGVRVPLDEGAVLDLAEQLRAAQVESVAVSFLHSYVNPRHEQRVAQLLKECLPALWVTLSSRVCPEVREYERTSTACANAYVQPVVAGYLQRLEGLLQRTGMHCPVYLMTSSGALTTLEMGAEQPVKLVESGPAGGAILVRQIAQQCGVERALSFDMGGTTAKICFIDDYKPQLSRSFEFGRAYRFLKGSGLPIRIPVIEMVEIGAGGGSIAAIDELGRVRVGPHSATSNPGPACFGRGGVAPTVTDANCVSGLLDPQRFAAGKIRLQPEQAARAIERDIARPLDLDVPAGAAAVNEIVAENMASAARVHGIELGKTIEGYTMIAFGGAAPLHAAQLAAKLGIERVIVPAAASVGSALGFLWAPVAYQALRSRYQRLDILDLDSVNDMLAEMRGEAIEAVARATGLPADAASLDAVAYMRYVGQGHEIAIELPYTVLDSGSAHALRELFETQYRELYGRAIRALDVEVMTWAVTASAGSAVANRHDEAVEPGCPQPDGVRDIHGAHGTVYPSVPVYERTRLCAGDRFDGPALVVEDQTTTAVPPEFSVSVNALNYLVLERRNRKEQGEAA